MKKIVVIVFFLFLNAAAAQSINNYKYALVPEKFTVTKKKTLPKLSVIAKMYLQKYGFETYISNEELPFDFSNSNCNKLFVDLIEDNSLLLTRIAVVLKDCKGTVLATSPMGKSKEKDMSAAYTEAVRQAFDGFLALKMYKYNGKVLTDTPTRPATSASQPANPVSQVVNPDMLYAQPIQNGFQLVNSEPKVVYKIFKTSNSDIYAAVKGDISGVFIPKGNDWFFEYYQNNQLISEKVNVKF